MLGVSACTVRHTEPRCSPSHCCACRDDEQRTASVPSQSKYRGCVAGSQVSPGSYGERLRERLRRSTLNNSMPYGELWRVRNCPTCLTSQ
jgi:hypothetical protein